MKRSARARIAAFVIVIATVAALPDAVARDEARFLVEFELGPAWQSRNNVEIPNDGTATRFSLADLVGRGPWAAGRVYFTWNITPRHGVRFLAAPLSYTETGTFDTPVTFVDRTFQPDISTDATYRFNSWRVGYRYRFHQGERWRWWVGFTAKIRDAEIRLSQPVTGSARKTDRGFVPLAHLSGDLRFANRWRFLLDLDGLAGGPGRAVDLSLKVGYDVGKHWTVTGGYRTVEGGVDIDDIYNFAWFNDVVFSGVYRWGKAGPAQP
jgi:hypothetical protein